MVVLQRLNPQPRLIQILYTVTCNPCRQAMADGKGCTYFYIIVRKSSKTSAAIIFIESVFGYSQRFHEPSQRTASRRILSDGSGRLIGLSYRCAMRIIRSIRRTTNPWSCFGTPRQKFRLRESGFGLQLHRFQKQKRRGSLQSANYSVLLGEQFFIMLFVFGCLGAAI